MRVQIKQECGVAKVLLDGKDISSKVTNVSAELKFDCVPIVKLEIVPDEIDVEGDFEVFKTIEEDKKKYAQNDININIQSGHNSNFLDYITKCIIMYQNEMTKSKNKGYGD